MKTNKLPPPLVTVIVPCHNKAATVARSIESVKQQTLNNLECFIINDSSTDDSERVILEAIKGDRRFKYEKVNYRNVALVRNHGASLASGLFLCPLDGDDWIEPTFLETCIKALQADRSLGVAYTGLRWHNPDGKTGVSDWPPKWNFDNHLKKQNQCPTCSVIRKECWDRLGGQRARYCAGGAGSEDGEFYLRVGAFGWKGEKVTEEALFNYSAGSGFVSGNPEYREVDWLKAWHPWVTDGLHPFASYATPRRRSHPVHQYDEPVVSVVIPVGPGHEALVVDALDSLEAQTFRKWEAIVVWDSDGWDTDAGRALTKAYPYVKFTTTMRGKTKWVKSMGAGFARNRGAEIARAPFLVFLDADDWLHPNCLQRFLDTWGECQAIAYSDYVGKAIVDDPGKLAPDLQERIYSRNEKTGESLLGYRAAEYDCARAQRQPDDVTRPYLWTNVTALIPKAWHDAAGGFDESLFTWEDVEYHWRLARLGYPYQRIPEELMMYRLTTGTRRDTSGDRQTRQSVIKYIREKLKGVTTMPCPGGCGGGKQRQPAMQATIAVNPFAVLQTARDGGPVTFTTWDNKQITVIDNEMAMAKYTSGNRGSHRVIGPNTRISYGQHSGGDVFLVHRRDLGPLFEEVLPKSDYEPPITEAAPLPPPEPIVTIAEPAPAPVAPVPQPKAAPLPPPPLPAFDLAKMNMAQVHSAIKGMSKQEAALALVMEQEGKKRPGVVKALTKAAGK